MRLAEALITVAAQDVGVIVERGGNNRGADVERLLTQVGRPPGDPWCAAYVYDAFRRACELIGGVPNPCPKTASVFRLWERAPAEFRAKDPLPGDVFVYLGAGGKGHTGIVTDVTGTHLITVDGNTQREYDPNDPAGRDGGGVWRRQRRRDLVVDGRPYFSGFIRFDRARP